MKAVKKHARHFVPHARLPLGRSLGVVAIFAVAALLGIQLLRAAGHVVGSEAESGTMAGNAAKVDDSTASNGQSVRFGTAGTPSVPGNVVAFTGGTSIAVRWNSSASSNGIKHYNIFRNGALVTSVTPTYKFLFPEKDGNGYLDTNITPGTTYTYQVQAVSNSDIKSGLSNGISARHPTSTTPEPNITYNTRGATDLEPVLRDKVIPFLKVWYPKIADRMAYPDYTPTASFSIDMDPTYTGLALYDWENAIIRVNPNWAKDNQNHPGYMGMYLHESTHVLHSGPNRDNLSPWIREALADWTREYIIRDREPRFPNTSEHYLNGYSPGAYFLDWIEKNYDSNFIRKVIIAGHKLEFSVANLTFSGNKNEADLWEEMTGRDLRIGPIVGVENKCADIPHGATDPHTRIQIWSCISGSSNQKWLAHPVADNIELIIGGRCLDVSGTNVIIFQCTGSDTQKWRAGPNSSIVNPPSGKCLQAVNNSTNDGTLLTTAICNGSSSQRWTLPN